MALASFQIARSPENRDDGAHAIVVVRLRTELLAAQFVGRNDLDGHGFRIGIPHGVQDDLADHRVVRHHHRHSPKEYFEVVREFRSTGIARVHRDERTTSHSQREVRALEHEPLRLPRFCLLNGQHLLRHDRQNF